MIFVIIVCWLFYAYNVWTVYYLLVLFLIVYVWLHFTLLQLYVINLASRLQYTNKLTYLLTGPGRAIGAVCVCLCLRATTFELNGF